MHTRTHVGVVDRIIYAALYAATIGLLLLHDRLSQPAAALAIAVVALVAFIWNPWRGALPRRVYSGISIVGGAIGLVVVLALVLSL